MKINIGAAYILLSEEEIKSLLDGKDIRITTEDYFSKANVIVIRLDEEDGLVK